ncbi:MAG: exonuclease VIII [Rhizobacter sp.]
MNARTLPVGIVRDLSNADYHAHPALGSSGLKTLAKSPRHFWASNIDPNRPEKEESAAMVAGTLAHCAILEPNKLAERYVARPEGLDLRTKDGKAWMAAKPAAMEVVTHEQMQAAQRQHASVLSLPEVGALLAKGQAEVSAFWVDEDTGTACKCRPDWVSPAGDGVVLVDIKTCQDASPKGFARAVANLRYDLQAAWYSHGFGRASGLQVLGFVFAAVEADYPHAAAAYMLDDDALSKARAECDRLLMLHRQCADSDKWPGYPETIQLLTMPAWANKE